MPAWEESYLGQLRGSVGPERVLITVGARAVLRDPGGRVLLIRRSDNGRWALPAGTMELRQTLGECAIREVREETGLTVHAITPFALYSGEQLTISAYGQPYQHVTLAVRADIWSGELLRETDETIDAAFYPVGELPETAGPNTRRTLDDLARFEAGAPFTLA
ncbi:NUDIX hydrolase [Actinoplanes sp. SE50]|uniref:NUDIX domain-containing protein n=1 Tax=unclassified Actinoplanes TaxID=2626549 RepID=UPI00023ED585|nr:MULTISPECIES: NUDIX domain-containing protein [unclassified Actinoplanes]AEV82819.1 MutT/NUDIX family protein [Actinoplanes sp. SE50/110]ATO81215.1 NUDIX hydrolase [Actinoplanes sp. SE50]SLL98622.1 NUDIX hydrolase [Actinoplanes sp. SE50/110]